MKKLYAIITITILALVAGTVQVQAVDLNENLKIGGSIRFDVSYLSADEDLSSTGDDLTSINTFAMNITELHMNYISDDKKYEGYVELGLLSGNQDWGTAAFAPNSVYSRSMYFKYNFDGGNILIGQTDSLGSSWYGPTCLIPDWAGINDFGRDWIDRNEQIRLTFGQKVQFKLALVAPEKTTNIAGSTSYSQLPALEAAIDYKIDKITIYPYARWERVGLSVTSSGKEVNWNSVDLGVDFVYDLDHYKLTAGVSYGLNSAGLYPVAWSSPYPIFDASFSNRADHHQLRFFGDVKIGDLHLGGGYAKASREDLNGVDQWVGNPSTKAVYANYWINFGKITFVPEVAWLDYGETTGGADRGKGLRVGLYAQLLF